MIINPLFIKPENSILGDGAIKSKFSNSSYLFPDIIKIVGLQNDKDLNKTVNDSNGIISMPDNLPLTSAGDNTSFTKLNLQSVKNIVTDILKQNSINPSDDPKNFQVLINNINKLAVKGKDFKLNLTLKNKSIDIHIVPEVNDNYDPALINSSIPNLNVKTTSSKNITLNNPLPLLSPDFVLTKISTSELTDKKGVDGNNPENEIGNVNPEKEGLCIEESPIKSPDSTQVNIIQLNPLIPELNNTVYAMNSTDIRPSGDNGSNCTKDSIVINSTSVNSLSVNNVIPVSSQVNSNYNTLISESTGITPVNMAKVNIKETTNLVPDNGNQTNISLNSQVQNSEIQEAELKVENSIPISELSKLDDNDRNSISVQIISSLETENKQNVNIIPNPPVNNTSYKEPAPVLYSNSGVTRDEDVINKNVENKSNSELALSNYINNSGKLISDVDLNRISGPGLQVNNSIKLFNVNVKVTSESSSLTPSPVSFLGSPINQTFSDIGDTSLKYFSDFNYFDGIDKTTETLPFINNSDNQGKSENTFPLEGNSTNRIAKDSGNDFLASDNIIQNMTNNRISLLSKFSSVDTSISSDKPLNLNPIVPEIVEPTLSVKSENQSNTNNLIQIGENRDSQQIKPDKFVNSPNILLDIKETLISVQQNRTFNNIAPYDENPVSTFSNNSTENMKSEVKPDFIKQHLESLGDDPIILQNNAPLEIKISRDRKGKGQRLVVTDKSSDEKVSNQIKTESIGPGRRKKQFSSEELSTKQEDYKKNVRTTGNKDDKKTDDALNANGKAVSEDSSGGGNKLNVIENKSYNNDPRLENLDMNDSTKAKEIMVNSNEAIKSDIQKNTNTNDASTNRSLESNIQNIAPVKTAGMPVRETGKSVSLPIVLSQPGLIKVKAEDVVKEIHRVLTSDDSRKVILNLQPEELGNVKIEFDIKEKTMNAKISVETESAKNLIQTNSDTLKNSLHDSGIALNSLNVSLSDGSRHQHTPNLKKKIQINEVIESNVEHVMPNKRNLGYNTYEYLA